MASKNTSEKEALIVLPTLGDRPDMLKQTFESLATQENLDVIVVCPRGNKEVVELAHGFGFSTIDDPKTGLSAALNIGFEQAKPNHKYAGWLGDDDLLRPGSVAKCIAALKANTDAVIAYGYCDYIDNEGNRLFTSRAGSLAPWIMTWGPNLLPLIGMLYRFEALKKAGNFDTSLKFAMDLDMLLRLRKEGTFINTRQTLGAFRWHATSTTVANREASLAEARMVKRKYLPRILAAISPIWEVPVGWATQIAAKRVNAMKAKQ